MVKRTVPILGRGQTYAELVTKPGGFPSDKEGPYTFEEAKVRLLSQIDRIISLTKKTDEKEEIFLSEKILCIRMAEAFEAKSYFPATIFRNGNLEDVGGRRYFYTEHHMKKEGKLYFARGNDADIAKLKRSFSELTSSNKSWSKQIRMIESIDILAPEEKLMGFEKEWTDGLVEIVLHPLLSDRDNAIELVKKVLHMNDKSSSIKFKHYENGPTFISTNCNKTQLNELKKLNILRAAHKLETIIVPVIRNSEEKPLQIESNGLKSTVTVGVFDGGSKVKGNPFLEPYVKEVIPIISEPHPKYIEHGTAVCGAVLYGDLGNKNKLKTPLVSVESFRVLPQNDTSDLDLYEVIDIIENVVSTRSDIKIFNLSLGPPGPIIEDSISRFTYALDNLTFNHSSETKPVFCVAVGNDGDVEAPFNRIQSPADIVNGVSIGAFTFDSKEQKIRAPYSCVGPGREGAKIKPDVLAFGGCKSNPFRVFTPYGLTIGNTMGTSFAAPLIANQIGEMLAHSEDISPQLARTIVIHNAENNFATPNESGYGFSFLPAEEQLMCSSNQVNIFYAGKIPASKFLKLPIFLPTNLDYKGKVDISWTLTTITNPNINDVDSYTYNGINETFYPHSQKVIFSRKIPGTKKNEQKKVYLNTIEGQLKAEELIRLGYRQGSVASDPAKTFQSESELRKQNYKWDTVTKKEKSMRISSLYEPYLVLHGMGRPGYEAEVIEYCLVATVSIPQYKGVLYTEILQEYPILQPIEIRNVNKIMVPINN